MERKAGMKLLYGTGNPAKLESMRTRLEKLNIELLGLQDFTAEGKTIPKVPEDGSTPPENARQKAIAYYEAFRMPDFPVIPDCILIMFRMRCSRVCM